MVPAFKPGDHVLTFNWGFVDVGDVVVFSQRPRFLIKRLSKVSNDRVEARGDNLTRSPRVWRMRKSRVVGKVILKY